MEHYHQKLFDGRLQRCSNIEDSEDAGTASSSEEESIYSKNENLSEITQISDGNTNAFNPANKSVYFDNRVQIVLIPSRLELSRFNYEMWWARSEVRKFQIEAHSEVQNYMRENKCSLHESLAGLYQHNNTSLITNTHANGTRADEDVTYSNNWLRDTLDCMFENCPGEQFTTI